MLCIAIECKCFDGLGEWLHGFVVFFLNVGLLVQCALRVLVYTYMNNRVVYTVILNYVTICLKID